MIGSGVGVRNGGGVDTREVDVAAIMIAQANATMHI